MSSFLKLLFFSIAILCLGSCQSDTNSANSANSAATDTTPDKSGPKDPTHLLEGRWENVASDKEFIIFDKGRMISRFAGPTIQEDKITSILYNFYEKCHAPCQTQSTDPDISKFQCFTVKDGIYKCYKITKLDAAELHFTLTDGTGPKYEYKRLQ